MDDETSSCPSPIPPRTRSLGAGEPGMRPNVSVQKVVWRLLSTGLSFTSYKKHPFVGNLWYDVLFELPENQTFLAG